MTSSALKIVSKYFPYISREQREILIPELEEYLITHHNQRMLPLDEGLVAQVVSHITHKSCRVCQTSLVDSPLILHYAHEGGWRIPGYNERRWLALVCPKCGNMYSLWKLGIPRDFIFAIPPTMPLHDLLVNRY